MLSEPDISTLTWRNACPRIGGLLLFFGGDLKFPIYKILAKAIQKS
jgi:hypothetical protein